MPLITVIIQFLNSERFLPSAIASVFGQTAGDWNLILVDGGSNDGSADFAKELAEEESRVRLLRSEGPWDTRDLFVEAVGCSGGEDLTRRAS